MADVLCLNADMAPINLLKLSVMDWQEAIKAVFLDTVTVVEEYPDWQVHSPSVTMNVPSVIMAKRHVHFTRLVSFSEDNVKLRDRYTCQYCHRVFPASKLTMDHVLPRKHGGRTAWDNIASACGPCNFRKGHNRKIVPRLLPRRPSYWEMVSIVKEYPLTIPCETWVEYLNWPEDKLFVGGQKILRTSLAA
jgi:5-methylcytosine-specific restriction endonuclease McrA